MSCLTKAIVVSLPVTKKQRMDQTQSIARDTCLRDDDVEIFFFLAAMPAMCQQNAIIMVASLSLCVKIGARS